MNGEVRNYKITQLIIFAGVYAISDEEIRADFALAKIYWDFRVWVDRLFAGYCRGDKSVPWLKERAKKAFQSANEFDLESFDPKAYAILKQLAMDVGDPFKIFEDHPLMRFYKLHYAEKQYFEDRKKKRQLKTRLKAEKDLIDSIFAAKPL